MENENTIESVFKNYFEIEAKLKELTKKKDELKTLLKKEIKEGDTEMTCGNYKVQIRHTETKTLKEDLIKKELGIDVTDACYKVTKSDKCYVIDLGKE